MDKIIVYVDDAAQALQHLAPMNGGDRVSGIGKDRPCTQWILVSCPPRMTRHVSRWVSYSARENWRQKWSDNLFAQIAPLLRARGDSVVTLVAKDPLIELTERLRKQHVGARVLDARRLRFGQDLQPVTADQPVEGNSRWSVPGALAGMGALLVLAAD